ncbi:MAG: Maf family nucleotide pyrophosphatase [Rickettsiales bacterium]|nr:Maf family nucleotide pyrophosphatase [Rickettsiales bacterium]
MSRPRFILASASPRRLALLKQIGITPDDIIPADIDETPRKGELPRHYVKRIAESKALHVSNQHANALILSADTTVAFSRDILPKAEDENEARACLKRMSGRRHHVLTHLCLCQNQKLVYSRTLDSIVQFKRLSQDDIDWYISTGEWEGKAGGYAIQGAAQALISFMRGSHSAIVGLPLYETKNALALQGITSD